MKLKNFLIRWLITAVQPMQKRKVAHRPPNSFLIVSTTGLGDTLWATPALRALRTSYPDSTISVLTTVLGEQILSRNKVIDEIFVLEEPLIWSAFRLFSTLRKHQFDAVVIFHASQRFILPFCKLLDVPRIVATKGLQKDLDFLLTDAIENRPEHEIERRLSLVQALGAAHVNTGLEFPLHKSEEQEAQQFLMQREIPDHLPLIGLHPGAKNKFKEWSPDNFIEVGTRLTQHTGCQIIVSGSAEEARLVYEIANRIPGAIPLAGELSVGTFAALIKRYALFITNDTGPMHLAFAVKTPTVALFGPTDPQLCGPWHAQLAEVIARPKTCSPCLRKRCQEPFCMLQISPDQVYDRAVALFFSSSATFEQPLPLY